MLSPNLSETAELFTEAFTSFKVLDSYVYMVTNTIVGTTTPEPVWLGTFRYRLKRLAEICTEWKAEKSELYASLFSPFISYSATLEGFVKLSGSLGKDTSLWIEALSGLSREMKQYSVRAETVEKGFRIIMNNLEEVQPLLDESLDSAWTDLAVKEKEMVTLATAITALQDKVARLQDELSAAEISGGKGYASNLISIGYSVVSAGAVSDFPFLTVVTLAYTMAKLTYDIISIEVEIGPALDNIKDLSNRLSEDAQSLALTKALIKLIYNYEKTFNLLRKKLPHFKSLWRTESDKIDEAIRALKAGADPGTFFDLQALSIAGETWKVLSKQALALTRPAIENAFLKYNE